MNACGAPSGVMESMGGLNCSGQSEVAHLRIQSQKVAVIGSFVAKGDDESKG